jgi:hypothetical protein
VCARAFWASTARCRLIMLLIIQVGSWEGFCVNDALRAFPCSPRPFCALTSSKTLGLVNSLVSHFSPLGVQALLSHPISQPTCPQPAGYVRSHVGHTVIAALATALTAATCWLCMLSRRAYSHCGPGHSPDRGQLGSHFCHNRNHPPPLLTKKQCCDAHALTTTNVISTATATATNANHLHPLPPPQRLHTAASHTCPPQPPTIAHHRHHSSSPPLPLITTTTTTHHHHRHHPSSPPPPLITTTTTTHHHDHHHPSSPTLMHDQVKYCSVCTMPHEFCINGSSKGKCKEKLKEQYPDIYAKLFPSKTYTHSEITLSRHSLIEQHLDIYAKLFPIEAYNLSLLLSLSALVSLIEKCLFIPHVIACAWTPFLIAICASLSSLAHSRAVISFMHDHVCLAAIPCIATCSSLASLSSLNSLLL